MAHKDLTNCIAKTKVHVDCVDKYWRVYLWKTHEDMVSQATCDVSGADAYHTTMPYFIIFGKNSKSFRSKTSPVMGELHFTSCKWDIEVVSHECCHAMFAYLSSQSKYDFNTEIEEEEKYCYLLGDLTKMVYHWLYDVDVDFI